jgi:exo-beta-1,3-glucanase (GH17 family)
MTPIFLEFPETNEYYQAQTSATFIKEFVEGDIIAVKAKYHGGSVTQIIIAGTGVSTFGGEYGSTQLGYCLVEIV